jgi:hypothetical protein
MRPEGRVYFFAAGAFMFVLPLACVLLKVFGIKSLEHPLALRGRGFVFWGVGVRCSSLLRVSCAFHLPSVRPK